MKEALKYSIKIALLFIFGICFHSCIGPVSVDKDGNKTLILEPVSK
jgi:hypothetical protein